MFGKKLVLLVFVFISLFAFNSCDAFSQKGGTFAVKFSWEKDGEGNEIKPDIASGDFFVTVRIYEWAEGIAFPGDVAAHGRQIVQSDPTQMKEKGTSINFGDLNYGDRRFIVAEIRRGADLTGGILYTGMSQLFDFKVGKHTEVNVEMSLAPTPGVDEEGARIDAELRIVNDDGSLKGYLNKDDLSVKLRLLNAVSFTKVFIANKEEFIKTENGKEYQKSDLLALEEKDGYEIKEKWGLASGLTADEIAVLPELKVYARVENEYGQGLLLMARIALDNQPPELTLGLNPAYTNGSKTITLNISANELIRHDTLNIQTTNDKLAFNCPAPTKNESLSFTCEIETLDAALKDGDYEITVTASDQAGNSVEDKTTLTVDRESPELTFTAYKNGTEVDDTIYLKENDEFKVELTLSKEPAETPVVKLGSAGINCEKTAELKCSCTAEINKETFTEGISDLSVSYHDMAENQFSGIIVSGIRLDYTPPDIVAVPVIRIIKPEDCPLKDVGRATQGSGIDVSFTVNENLKQIPVVRAYFESSEIEFGLSSQMGDFFTFTRDMDFDLTEGTYRLEIALIDIVGNFKKVGIEDIFEIKTRNPSAPFVNENGIVYRRIPYGSDEIKGDVSFRLKAVGHESVVSEDVSFITVHNTDDLRNALEIGSSSISGGMFEEFELNRSDRTEVYLVAYDNACNRSDAVKVRNVEWTVSMGQKDQGSINPHKFIETPRFLEILRQDAKTSEPLDIQNISVLNGIAVEKTTQGRWNNLHNNHSDISSIEGNRMIYDSNRGVIIVFNDDGRVFEYDAITQNMEVFNTKTGTDLSGPMIYNKLNGKVYLFKGKQHSYVDVLEWDRENGKWTVKMASCSEVPEVWEGYRVAFDHHRDKMILYGTVRDHYLSYDVWEWDVESGCWEKRIPVGEDYPPALYHSMIYDSTRKKIVLFGGIYSDEESLVWEWDSTTGLWENRTEEGAKPEKRYYSSMVYDSIQRKVYVTGGGGFYIDSPEIIPSGVFDDLWEWDAVTGEWSEIISGDHLKRVGSSMAYSSVEEKILVFGGYREYDDEEKLNDFWSWDINKNIWSEWKSSDFKPSFSFYTNPVYQSMSSCYDYDRDKMILFGSKNNLSEIWEWCNTLNFWTDRTNDGIKPPARLEQSMVYDPVRKKCIVFGGSYVVDEDRVFFDDIWEWDVETGDWAERTPEGLTPGNRWNHSMIYDNIENKFLVFGGMSNYFVKNDLWQWDSITGNWAELIIEGEKPLSRFSYSMIYDPGNKNALLFGGVYFEDGFHALSDIWKFDVSEKRWVQVTHDTEEPLKRFSPSIVFDSVRNKVMVQSGFDCDSGGYCYENPAFWEWDLDTGMWREIILEDTPFFSEYAGLAGNNAFFNVHRQRMTIYNGEIWEYDAGDSYYPAHIMQTFFTDSKADEPVEITSVGVKFYSAGRGFISGENQYGAELKVWRSGKWEKLDENDISLEYLYINPESGLLQYEFNNISTQKSLFYGDQKTLNFAVTPIAPNGTGTGVIATDYAEVIVRYRIE
jgi:hypothetical protein